VRRDVKSTRNRTATEHLHEVLLATESLFDQDVVCDLSDTESAQRVEVDRRVLHAKGIRESLQLGDALEEWNLSTFETLRNLATSLLTLGTTSGGLATLTSDTSCA
jgi:hypothetical protein